MSNKKKNNFYVVWEGKTPGIYKSWHECEQQVKNHPGAKYKGCETLAEAEIMYRHHWSDFYEKKEKSDAPPVLNLPKNFVHGIAVDASSIGNPGKMEYRGVDSLTGIEIFHSPKFPHGTNNIGEFLAVVHALALFNKTNQEITIYSDSRIALSWVKQKKCKTKLPENSKSEKLFEVIVRAEKWLKTHSYKNPVKKWETKEWGEIPADYGRK